MQIGSLIRRAALQFGDASCLTEGKRTLSFRDFDQATDRLANALLDKGLRKADRVSVILPNSIDCLIAYYAIAKAGLVRVQLNTKETLENHRYKIQDSGSRAALLHGLRKHLVPLPPETRVYAGHGPRTTIGHECETNPYLYTI